ncbi:MAG TPA: malto-oligosyltrehalose trehalohydrolase [Vicinamibacterales bacterium]|nr:malto-oligosyltrehalose trehalohydrolase [Vicinamibacterales bacterium]
MGVPALGAVPQGDGTAFCVWAPAARRVEVVISGNPDRIVRLTRDRDGYFSGFVEGARAGDRYRYRLDGSRLLPDPASRFQPEGVHGPSEIVDPSAFEWSDAAWRGIRREDLVIYELHIGTFTSEGTFAAARERLADLAALGVTAIEIMPVAEFPGSRNWGYDGADLFAPSRAYGRPDDLRRLVDTAHARGLAVILDVVYNHFGPEGAYHAAFAPEYFTGRHRTPWGNAINLDGPRSPHVRRFFIENALHWLREYHVDGFRLDATHALIDESPVHFIQELTAELRRHRSNVIVTAEDERRLPELIRPASRGGWDLDACWADDLHHQVRRLLTGDHEGYFARYSGTAADIATTIERGWFFRRTLDGRTLRADAPGAADETEPFSAFIVCLQNHDQVGNRAFGDRLHHTIDAAAFRAATALLLLAPETPLLFMGQEWAASSPFQYFTDHPEPLGWHVTEGRRAEFSAFSAFTDPEARTRIPDPQAASTFEVSRLRWEERSLPPHASALRLHQRLLQLRRTHPALAATHGASSVAGRCVARALGEDTIAMRREGAGTAVVIVRLRGAGAVTVPPELSSPAAPDHVALTTEEPAFAEDPAPPAITSSAHGRLQVAFSRPGAVLFTC